MTWPTTSLRTGLPTRLLGHPSLRRIIKDKQGEEEGGSEHLDKHFLSDLSLGSMTTPTTEKMTNTARRKNGGRRGRPVAGELHRRHPRCFCVAKLRDHRVQRTIMAEAYLMPFL